MWAEFEWKKWCEMNYMRNILRAKLWNNDIFVKATEREGPEDKFCDSPYAQVKNEPYKHATVSSVHSPQNLASAHRIIELFLHDHQQLFEKNIGQHGLVHFLFVPTVHRIYYPAPKLQLQPLNPAEYINGHWRQQQLSFILFLPREYIFLKFTLHFINKKATNTAPHHHNTSTKCRNNPIAQRIP